MLTDSPVSTRLEDRAAQRLPRIGVTIMTPLIPVAVFTFDWPRAITPHAITNTRTSTRADIVIYPLFRNSVVEANIRVNASALRRGEGFRYFYPAN